MKRATIYVHSDKEYMFGLGVKLGLANEALNYFKYTAYEVELTIEVNEENGESTIVAVNGVPLEKQASA